MTQFLFILFLLLCALMYLRKIHLHFRLLSTNNPELNDKSFDSFFFKPTNSQKDRMLKSQLSIPRFINRSSYDFDPSNYVGKINNSIKLMIFFTFCSVVFLMIGLVSEYIM